MRRVQNEVVIEQCNEVQYVENEYAIRYCSLRISKCLAAQDLDPIVPLSNSTISFTDYKLPNIKKQMSIDIALGQSTSTFSTKETWPYKFLKLSYQKSSIRILAVRSESVTTSPLNSSTSLVHSLCIVKSTLPTSSTCRDHVKIRVGIVLELGSA